MDGLLSGNRAIQCVNPSTVNSSIRQTHLFSRAPVEGEAFERRGDRAAALGLPALGGRSAVHFKALATHALASDCVPSHCLGICTYSAIGRPFIGSNGLD